MRIAVVVVGVGAALFACKYDPPPVTYDADPPPDMEPAPDAQPCEPDTQVCDDESDVYVACSSEGTPLVELQCPRGCSETDEKCVDIDPSNGLGDILLAASSADPLVFQGLSSINTGDGAVVIDGQPVDLSSDMVGDIRVFTGREITVHGTLVVYGTAALALVADGEVLIDGTIDVSANHTTAGPGAATGAITDSCEGAVGELFAGGGGGGARVAGAAGGDANGSDGTETRAPGGEAAMTAELVPLRGGCRGGRARIVGASATGGGGGGALQIVSRTQIRIAGSAVIDASGGGGISVNGPNSDTGGSGGGGGGAVLMEAPTVIVAGSAVVISTKGGGGGGADRAYAGDDGGITSLAANGGAPPSAADGGDGGISTDAPDPGQDGGGSLPARGAGGGGAAGVVRFNVIEGAPVMPANGAVIRSAHSTGELRTRLIP